MTKKQSEFEFGIIRILDCGFLIEEAVPKDSQLQIGYGLSFLFDTQNNWIQYIIRVSFKDAVTGVQALTGTVLTRFSVKNLAQYIDKVDKITFPEGSIETLFGIAFSHMRAIVSKNVSGSRFTNIIVPVVNTHELFDELIQSNLDKPGKSSISIVTTSAKKKKASK